jgi:hypothetical protein
MVTGMLVARVARIQRSLVLTGRATAHLAALRVRLAGLPALLPLVALLLLGLATAVTWEIAFVLACHFKSSV